MNASIIIIAAFAVFALAIGVMARRGRKLTLEQWAVGGRGFGSLLTFLLMAGEAFSTFSFLGASGWTYSKGVPAFYILSYGCLAFVIGYWMLPAIWRYAKERGLVSFADYFASKYDSRAIGVLVSIVAVFAMVSLLMIQLRGLGVIVSEMSYGLIPQAAAIWIAATLMAVYMVVSGIHGSASIAIFKDVLILAIAIFLGLYLPMHYYGGLGEMFAKIDAAHPELLRMPEHGFNLSWYNSTILLTSLGYYLYPHGFTAIYVAKDERALRRNVILMPLYQVLIAFLFLVGFAAVMTVHGLEGAQTGSRAAAPREADVPRVVRRYRRRYGPADRAGAGIADHAQRLDDDRPQHLPRRLRAERDRPRSDARRADRTADLHAGGRLLRAARRCDLRDARDLLVEPAHAARADARIELPEAAVRHA